MYLWLKFYKDASLIGFEDAFENPHRKSAWKSLRNKWRRDFPTTSFSKRLSKRISDRISKLKKVFSKTIFEELFEAIFELSQEFHEELRILGTEKLEQLEANFGRTRRKVASNLGSRTTFASRQSWRSVPFSASPALGSKIDVFLSFFLFLFSSEYEAKKSLLPFWGWKSQVGFKLVPSWPKVEKTAHRLNHFLSFRFVSRSLGKYYIHKSGVPRLGFCGLLPGAWGPLGSPWMRMRI